MVGLDAAEHRLRRAPECEPFERACHGDQSFPPARSASCARRDRAKSPGPSVPITARSTSRSEWARPCRRQLERPTEPAASLAHRRKRLGMPRRGRAEPMQRVRAPAELLQDRVVGDRSQLARMPHARRGTHRIADARGGPRAGGVEQVRPECPEQRAVSRVLHQSLHAGPDRGKEIGGEIRLRIHRVFDRPGGRMERVLGDPRHCRQGEFRCAEREIAVAALECALLAHEQRGATERLAAGGWREVLEPVGKRCRDGRRGRCSPHGCRTAPPRRRKYRSGLASRRFSTAAARSDSLRRAGPHSGRNRSSRIARQTARSVCR